MFRIIYGVILGGFLSYLLLIASMTYSSSVQTKLIDEPVTGLRGYVYDYLVRYNTTIPFNKGYFFPEKNDKTGVVLDNPEKSWGEYTVYNSADTHAVSVINRGGTEVFSWDASIFKIWPEETKDIITKTPEFSFTAMARNFLDKYHPGNIYVMQGGHKLYLGLVKLDQDSHVLWKTAGNVHHFLEQLEDGRLLTFFQELRVEKHPALPEMNPPYYEEFLLILDSSDGHEIKKISLLDAFQNSDYSGVLDQIDRQPDDPDMEDGDLLHPNTITYIDDAVVNKAPMLTPNSVMLSFRNIDVLAILNLETEKITWAAYGPWKGQHHPTFLKNGHVIMHDNNGNLGPGGASRVLEVDLNDLSIVWEYTGTKENPYYSKYNGMIQVLPNDNILVTESGTGRIFEVTRDKEIVWDYYIDRRYDFLDALRVPSVFNGYRLSKEQAFWQDQP